MFLNNNHSISVYEHGRLTLNDPRFKRQHLDALLKLNEFNDFQYFDVLRDGVKFKQYVGIIQVDGLTIEIHPKADKDDADGRWRNVLLQMLQACGRIKAQSAGAANVNRQNLNLLEVYFELFITEIQTLQYKGLVKQYRKETGNVKALKGKLEFAGNIRHNLVHKERFYTTHQVYDTDHLLHQVLLEALKIVEHFSKGTRLYDKCKRVLLNFPEVKIINVSAQQLNQIKLNRKTQAYSYGLELARLIILNYSPDISEGRERMLSLLFNMNELWEEYVFVKLRMYANEFHPELEIIGQDSKAFWQDNDTNYSRYIKPDIVVKDRNQTYIIDTKWKRPQNQKASIEDIRQMYAYNRLWNSKKAILLYPGSEENRSGTYHDKIGEDNHQCSMSFVSVIKKDEDDEFVLNDNIGAIILNEFGIKVIN